jgi:iron only hydrogenase large subunit-like protein
MDKQYFHHALNIREEVCIGCSHCMRVCPTEAIRVRDGKSRLDPNRCIDCGECFRVCPVEAITIEDDDFNKIFDYTSRIALVPAIFMGQFPEDITAAQIFAGIKDLGFTHVFEVEQGVEILRFAMTEYAKTHEHLRPLISSFCPAVIRLIQVKFPSLTDNIMLLRPPLDVSAMYYRKKLVDQGANEEEMGIFYVTPCAAKIAAVKSPVGEESSVVTGVINMDVLYNKVYRIIKKGGSHNFDVPGIRPLSSYSITWSLTGGESELMHGRCLAIDEIHNVIAFLEKVENEEIGDIDFLELRACDQSCAGGVLTNGNRFLTTDRLRKRARVRKEKGDEPGKPEEKAITAYHDYLTDNISLTTLYPRSMHKFDDDMGIAMKKMNRFNELKKIFPQVDCGVCGAPSCQALAEDIVKEKANLTDCIFVQKIYEQRGSLSQEDTVKIMTNIWGDERINPYSKIE